MIWRHNILQIQRTRESLQKHWRILRTSDPSHLLDPCPTVTLKWSWAVDFHLLQLRRWSCHTHLVDVWKWRKVRIIFYLQDHLHHYHPLLLRQASRNFPPRLFTTVLLSLFYAPHMRKHLKHQAASMVPAMFIILRGLQQQDYCKQPYKEWEAPLTPFCLHVLTTWSRGLQGETCLHLHLS